MTRDAGTCRTPWCDAPARHVDHVRGHADDGPTTESNGQGLCVRCNLTKQLPGFTAVTAVPDPTSQPGATHGLVHTVLTMTPTGHSYTSHAPPLLPGLLLPDEHQCGLEPVEPDRPSPLERALELALAA
ncbi:HNH endonuclease [Terrabacter sp. 2RAF25]|uniref:HNH endonuclease n=1 Tax=Terrabacter sp. 2RAF25 TaxID=3232998 RepID=UPI003F97BCB4